MIIFSMPGWARAVFKVILINFPEIKFPECMSMHTHTDTHWVVCWYLFNTTALWKQKYTDALIGSIVNFHDVKTPSRPVSSYEGYITECRVGNRCTVSSSTENQLNQTSAHRTLIYHLSLYLQDPTCESYIQVTQYKII